jgi:hypothetical protein
MAQVPSSRAPLVDAEGVVTPQWFRFFAEGALPQETPLLWLGAILPLGYVQAGTIAGTATDGSALPIKVIIRGNA